ncbi:MAG: hypothetical protein QM764_19860 [Chitinophagaceae bacterium]
MKKILALISTVLIAWNDNAQSSQNSIDKFWKWFEANKERIHNIEASPEEILKEVSTNAKKIREGIAFEFEPAVNGIINVTVSADGDRNLFSLVKAIVKKAPKLPGYNFIAFRQRLPKEKLKTLVLKAGDHELDINKMKFYPIISGDTLDIVIFAIDVTELNYNQIAYGGLLMVDNILGEYDCVMKVHSYDFQAMPTKPQDIMELRPLIDLAAFVDNFYKLRKH